MTEWRKKEELLNTITHGIGMLLAIAGSALLITISALEGTSKHIIGFSIFGASLVALYLASTLYHSTEHQNIKSMFRKFDHMAIFVLIAGTYTPFCLTALPGWVGYTVLALVWLCAIIGIVLKIFLTGKYEKLSTFFYVIMGWLIIPAIQPLYISVSLNTFLLLLAGGFFYTTGVYFFVKDSRRFFHSIWHLFVLAGSIFHFLSVASLLN